MNKKQLLLKRLSVPILCATLVATPAFNAFAKDITINLNGVNQTSARQPSNEKGYLMLDGKYLAELLGLEAVWNEADRTLVLAGKTTKAQYKDGNTSYTFNGAKRYLPVMTTANGETLSLPLRQVCEAFGFKVSWNPTSQTVSISTAAEDAAKEISSMLVVPSASAKKMSYNDALATAIEKNSTLKNLYDTTKYAEERHREFVEVNDLSLQEVNPIARFNESAELIAWMQGLTKLESNMTVVKLTEEITRYSTEMILRDYILQIKSLEIDMAMVKESLALAQTNWTNVSKKESVGMASASELREAKQDLDKQKLRQSSLETTLKKQRLGLNQLLGGSAEDVIEVVYTPSITPVSVQIESYATSKTADDPKIKMLQEDLRVARYNLDTFNETDNTKSDKISVENAVDEAERALSDGKDSMEQSIRTSYYNLATLNDNQGTLNLELQKAKDAYNNALVNLEAGYLTNYTVDQAKLGIMNCEASIAKNVMDYDKLYYAFQHPFLLS